MKEITIYVNVDNAAFLGPDDELRRVLTAVVDNIVTDGLGSVYDINGNTVARWSVRTVDGDQ